MRRCLIGDVFKLSKMDLPKAKLIIADPECGLTMGEHINWIHEVMKCLTDDGVLMITGHPMQKLFKTPNKEWQFLTIKKDDEMTITEFKDCDTWYKSVCSAIKVFTTENDMIFDIFAGKGQGCFAAKVIGRNFVGIESDSQKVSIINEKLKLINKEEDVTYDLIFK